MHTTDPTTTHRGVMATVGPRGLADITADLDDTDTAALEATLFPTATLALAALNPDGSIADPQAFGRLQAIGNGGTR